jgi:hypothetical protein
VIWHDPHVIVPSSLITTALSPQPGLGLGLGLLLPVVLTRLRHRVVPARGAPGHQLVHRRRSDAPAGPRGRVRQVRDELGCGRVALAPSALVSAVGGVALVSALAPVPGELHHLAPYVAADDRSGGGHFFPPFGSLFWLFQHVLVGEFPPVLVPPSRL